MCSVRRRRQDKMSSTVFVAGSRLNCNRRSSLSADAQIVWDALVKKHEQRIKTQNTHCKPDRCTYYKTLNQHSFGASLPNTNGTSRPDTNSTSLPDTNGICAKQQQQQKTECNSQPLFPHSQPRMGTWDEGAGNAEATFSLAYLSQFTNTQSYSPPLDLSPESDLDRIDHSQSMKTAEMKTVSPQHSDISTVTHHSPSVTTKSVFCHSTSNYTVTMMTHSDKFDGPDCCGSSESVVLDTSVGRGSYEPVCFPHKGGCNAGSGLREQQNRELFKKPIGGKSTQHVGHIDSDSIAPPRGTLAQSSLKKVTKRKASSETSADVDLRTLEYFLESAGKPREKKTNKYAYSTPVKRTKTNDLTSLAGNVKSSRREGEHSLLWPVDELSDNARDRLVESLRQAHEIALSLVYTNGSTQLREQTENKVAGVAFAYPKCTNPVCVDFGDCSNIVLQFAYVPLNSQNSAYAWSRAVLEELMSVSRTRKLCFDGQELIQNLILHFGYSHSTVSTKWRVLDVKIASWLLDSDNPAVTFTEVIDHYPEVKQMRTDSSNGKDIICGDLKLLGPITTKLYQQLQNAALWELFEKIEMPLCPLLAVMELRGISIDTSVMIKSGYVLKKKLGELEKEIYSAAGRPFVITSHPQLRQILFEELKLDSRLPPNKHVVRTLVKQQKSTSEAVLTVLQDVHPLPALILQYRQVQKLKSTYVDSLLGFVKGTQLHTHWDHTAAATGRLTSTDPNIQAIPKVPLQITPVKETGEELTGTGKRFSDGQAVSVSVYAREPFISQQGYSLLSADFKQIELRLLAHLSGDSALLRVFNNPNSDDIFKDLTSQWLGKNRRDVTEKEREQTKRVVYSVMYGAGKERLAEYLKISPDEAKCIMNSFLVMFPGVNRFTRKCIEEAREKGYQETIFRRRRQLPHIHHWRAPLRAQCERQAVNFCVQGSAADLCKAAMLQVEEALATRPHCRLLVQIHDELLLEVPDTEIDTVAEIVRTIMQSGDGLCRNFTKLRVPLKVSIHMGKSWAHMNTWASLGHT
ncbi:DNA polymerase nu [Lamellibrachia satsuma]|nr:DNA polymerase nu [Lamellibrachia satsuma]